MGLTTRTIIKWRETLLGIKIGGMLEMKTPPSYTIPSSLSSMASQLKRSGIATFKMERSEGKLVIKRIA